MTKKEACEALGVSERTLDKYARAGRLTVQYIPIKTGRRADFDAGELEKFKAELEEAQKLTPALPPQTGATPLYAPSANPSQNGARAEQRQKPQGGAIELLRGIAPAQLTTANSGERGTTGGASNGAQMVVLSPEHFPLLARALAGNLAGSEAQSVPVSDRLTLDIDGAAALSGVSRSVIRSAISAGQLPARRIGRGWKVEKSALEAWVKSLFEDSTANNQREKNNA